MDLAAFLKSQGYIEIPFVRNRVGHLELNARVNGEDALLVLDTGASGTVFDRVRSQRLHLQPQTTSFTATGYGTSNATMDASVVDRLSLGEFSVSSLLAFLIDLSHVNATLQQQGVAACDGVLGADILTAHEAVIDYKALRLYLKHPMK